MSDADGETRSRRSDKKALPAVPREVTDACSTIKAMAPLPFWHSCLEMSFKGIRL